MATHDLERVRAIKEQAQGWLLAISGVHGVGLGAKYVGGEHTGEPAIMVFVEHKRPAAELKPEERIPPEIDGVKTDIIEAPRPHILLDEGRYRPLAGGIQIRAGGSLGGIGTLGFIAHTNEPVPRLMGITNQHVVGSVPRAGVTLLKATISFGPSAPLRFTISGANRPRSMIIVGFNLRSPTVVGPRHMALYATTPADTPSTIAIGVATAINSLVTGATATPNTVPGSVDFTAPAPGVAVNFDVNVYGPHRRYDNADLLGAISGNEITLIGKTSDHYGVFVNWNAGGLTPTQGVFVKVAKGTELAQVAAAMATAVNARALPGIVATPTGQKITIAGAQYVECEVGTDMRVGQASDCFCSLCCACCRDRIGVVADARIDIDAALIQLDPGLQYHPEIVELGAVKGSRTYTFADLVGAKPLVHKRGRSTNLTLGAVVAVEQVGTIGQSGEHGTPDEWRLFHRTYNNAMSIVAVSTYTEPGDSGSAVVNEAGEVVGLHFGGGGTAGLATPIGLIEAAFDLSVEVAANVGEVRTVAGVPGDAMVAATPEPIFVDRLRALEQELTRSEEGRAFAALGRRHLHELAWLVNHNRRVGAVWRRNGGPELIAHALATVEHDLPPRLPQQINGRPLSECLRRMQAILVRYGSEGLAKDLGAIAPRIIELVRLDYPGLLAALGAAR